MYVNGRGIMYKIIQGCLVLVIISLIFGIGNQVIAQEERPVEEFEGYFNIGERTYSDGTRSYEYYLFVDEGQIRNVPYFLQLSENVMYSNNLFEICHRINYLI